ncbi:peptidoglycan-binding domain-containing protein, partial [Streptomyces hainanensis]
MPGTRETRHRRGRGRGTRWAAVVLLAGATGTAALVAARPWQGEDGATGGQDPEPPATAEVTRETLDDTREVEGELGHGPTSTVANRLPGTITWLPESGAEIGRGETLFRVDDRPVPLLHGSVPAHRDLAEGVDDGPDVEQLERNLAELGYPGFTVDEEFTDRTAAAVRDWQEDLGLPGTGAVELGRVVFAPGDVRVDGLLAEIGRPAVDGTEVFTRTGTSKLVTMRLEVSDRLLAEPGTQVSVGLPGGGAAAGEIGEVFTVIVPDGEG